MFDTVRCVSLLCDLSSAYSPMMESAPTLISSVSAVRTVVQSFLDDYDSGCLVRVSRTFAQNVLANFVFRRHVFRPNTTRQQVLGNTTQEPKPKAGMWQRLSSLRFGRRSHGQSDSQTITDSPRLSSADDVRHMTELYSGYEMHITRMQLADMNEPLLDGSTRSLLPPSLLALTFGSTNSDSSILAGLSDEDEERLLHPDNNDYRIVPSGGSWEPSWPAKAFPYTSGEYNQPILPDVMPHSLMYLQLNSDFNQPLVDGCLPPHLIFLQLGRTFNQPLMPAVLPESLLHLDLHSYTQEFLKGSLPASLRTLRMDGYSNQPLPPGILPSSLLHLSLGQCFDREIVAESLPSSLRSLELGHLFTRPLRPGVLPSSLQYLSLGDSFHHTLEHGVLPRSLRVLLFGVTYRQPLHVGVIPEGVEALRLPVNSGRLLSAGVIPSTTRWLDLGSVDAGGVVAPGQIAPGAIPAGVRWLKLEREHQRRAPQVIAHCVDVEVVWYRERGNVVLE